MPSKMQKSPAMNANSDSVLTLTASDSTFVKIARPDTVYVVTTVVPKLDNYVTKQEQAASEFMTVLLLVAIILWLTGPK